MDGATAPIDTSHLRTIFRRSTSSGSSSSSPPEFDSLPELMGRPGYRVLVGTGYVVAAFVVVGQLASDGLVELVEPDLDGEPPLTGTESWWLTYHRCINPRRVGASEKCCDVRLRRGNRWSAH